MRGRTQGLSIVELLIALAVIGIAFGALAFTQLTNLQASTRSRAATEAKAEATRVLEATVAQLLRVETVGMDGSTFDDDETVGSYMSYYFTDYYYACPAVQTPPSGVRAANSAHLRFVASDCSGSVGPTAQPDGSVTTAWDVAGQGGAAGEGLVLVTVTATHSSGASVTLTDTISCYDIYPSPTVDAPDPCPVPSTTGGGRS